MKLVGTVTTDQAAREAVARDFGGIIHERPAIVVRPACTADVVEALRFARARGLKVAPRGVGHSAGGQGQVDGGLVLDMTALGRVRAVDAAGGTLDADAGARWSEVMDALMPLGLTPPVVTDWLHLTLGGTVTAGGVGSQSFRRGIQCDWVLELEVVTGAGEVIVCSAEQEPGLFDAVRAGLGQFGVITRVKMRVEPAPDRVTLHHLVYDELAAFHADVGRLASDRRFDTLLAHAIPNGAEAVLRHLGLTVAGPVGRGPWLYDLEAARYHDDRPPPATDDLRALPGLHTAETFAFHEYVRRVPPIIERDEREGAAPHPEFTMFVPGPEALAWMTRVMDDTPPAYMGGGPILIIPIARAAISTPMFRVPDTELVWLLGILAAAPTPERLAEVTARNVALYAEARAAGAFRYACDALPVPRDRAGWADHYGPMWDRVVAWKRRFDPDHLLVPRLRMFAAR